MAQAVIFDLDGTLVDEAFMDKYVYGVKPLPGALDLMASLREGGS